MRPRLSFALIFASLAVTSLSAHIMVSPPQSQSGATQKYEMRVHNEGKVAATSIELDVPDEVTVLDVAKPAQMQAHENGGNLEPVHDGCLQIRDLLKAVWHCPSPQAMDAA